MHKHMLPNEDDVARFEREMRFAALMAHPNIVTVYTTGTWDGAPFLVMEYLKGHDLEKALPSDDAERIAGIGRDVCSGLAYAHGEGVIHRDIKPANLFLCESGQVKNHPTSASRGRSARRRSSTAVAVLVGTFAYMPPERWRGASRRLPSAATSGRRQAACSTGSSAATCARLLRRRVAELRGRGRRRGEPVPDLRDITDAPCRLAGRAR